MKLLRIGANLSVAEYAEPEYAEPSIKLVRTPRGNSKSKFKIVSIVSEEAMVYEAKHPGRDCRQHSRSERQN
jgi:hypothetical protein